MATSGFFLVVEGPEGAGKSTLARALADRMTTASIPFIQVREPGGTPTAEALRQELLIADRAWTAEMELLYIATARADLVSHVIRPGLESGKVVLSDRYDLSTLAYQGAARELPLPMVAWVNHAATGGLRPDLVLVLDLPAAIGRDRQLTAGKRQDRLDRESGLFHERVETYYRQVRGESVHHLDATHSPGELLDEAWQVLQKTSPRFSNPAAPRES